MYETFYTDIKIKTSKQYLPQVKYTEQIIVFLFLLFVSLLIMHSSK